MFKQGTEQARLAVTPAAGSVIMPGLSYGNAVFETYSIDVRSDPSDAGTSISTASFITQFDDNNNCYLTGTSGMLSFAHSESQSSSLSGPPSRRMTKGSIYDAAGRPDSERLRAGDRKTPLQKVSQAFRERPLGPGRPPPQLTRRLGR